jgi:hypothetical protein
MPCGELRRLLSQMERGRAVWLNTEGTGVSWLHVRVDSRPKYYQSVRDRRRCSAQRATGKPGTLSHAAGGVKRAACHVHRATCDVRRATEARRATVDPEWLHLVLHAAVQVRRMLSAALGSYAPYRDGGHSQEL